MPPKIISYNRYRSLPQPSHRGGLLRSQFRDGYLKYTIDDVDIFDPADPRLFVWYISDLEDTIFASGYACSKSECVDKIRAIAAAIKAYYAANPAEAPAPTD